MAARRIWPNLKPRYRDTWKSLDSSPRKAVTSQGKQNTETFEKRGEPFLGTKLDHFMFTKVLTAMI